MTRPEPYPEYQDTGHPWLSTLPAKWSMTQVGREAWVRARLGWKGLTADEYVDVGYPMLATPNIKNRQIDFASANRISPERYDESPEIQLKVGDVLLTKDGSTIGTVNIVETLPEPATVNGSIALITAGQGLYGRYFFYVCRSEYARAVFDRFRGGMGVPHLFQRDLNRIYIPRPSLDEQHAIVDYLDRETAQIDALIGKQERLIETLRERRAAVVERVVSGGLDGTPVKPSGLTWTASVPDHWTVANIRRFAQMKTGHTPSRSTPDYWVGCSIPWVTLADVWQLRSGRLTWLSSETNAKINEVGLANSAAELLPAGTVVLSRTASVGFTGIMPVPMATSQDYWNWVCGPSLLPEFLVWTFRAMRKDILGLMIGSTHKTIYQPVAASIAIAVPPLEEQRRITDYLDKQTAKIDALIAKAERFIEVSKERRSALITAAVTGQIDVRDRRIPVGARSKISDEQEVGS